MKEDLTIRILNFSKKIPGFYAYRPKPIDMDNFEIEEITLKIPFQSHFIFFHFYFDGIHCSNAMLEILYDDFSIATIPEKNQKFNFLFDYRNQLIEAFNQLTLA